MYPRFLLFNCKFILNARTASQHVALVNSYNIELYIDQVVLMTCQLSPTAEYNQFDYSFHCLSNLIRNLRPILSHGLFTMDSSIRIYHDQLCSHCFDTTLFDDGLDEDNHERQDIFRLVLNQYILVLLVSIIVENVPMDYS